MTLSDHSLQQLDEQAIGSLPEAALRVLAIKLLVDLKEARERLNRNSQNSSIPPGSEAPWDKAARHGDEEQDDEAEAAQALADEEAMPGSDCNASDDGTEKPPHPQLRKSLVATESHRKPGTQPGAPGFGRVESVPLQGQVHQHPNRCACCGHEFQHEPPGTAYTAFDQLDMQCGDADRPGIRVINTRHVYYQETCPCGHTTREEPARQPPDELLEGVELSPWRLVGAGLAAWIVGLLYRIRLSRQRIREFLHDWLGFTLSVGTLHKVILASGRAALPLEDQLVQEVRQSTVAYADETSWYERTRLLCLWVFVSATVVAYWIAHRSEEWIQTVLGEAEFTGWFELRLPSLSAILQPVKVLGAFAAQGAGIGRKPASADAELRQSIARFTPYADEGRPGRAGKTTRSGTL